MNPRVLIVDDVESVRGAVAELLEASGEFDAACEAADGAAALALAREQRPELVVMDIRMPGMGGIEATKAIREECPGVTVIAHSAYQDVSLVRDMIAAGATGYVLKGGGGEQLLEALRAARNGHAVLEPEVTRAILDDLQKLYAAQVQRADDLQTQAVELQEASLHDHLTGLRNHRAFQEDVEAFIAAAERTRQPLSVAILDVDYFKLVNDLYGHATGDRLLHDIAEALAAVIGDRGRMYRIGGDEFAALFPDAGKEAVLPLLESARGAIADRKFGQLRQQTLSIGLAAYPADGVEKDHVIVAADSAMYEAKGSGKDKVFVAGVTRASAALAATAADDSLHRTVTAVTAALGVKSEATLRHCEEVSELAAAIAKELGMSAAEIETVRLGALLHDVGKIGVHDDVLQKSGTLDATERRHIQQHAEMGRTILGRTLPRAVVDCVAHHHEQPDGRGYPLGLNGDEIPFAAGVVRVADVFDSFTRHQPWRAGLTAAQAIDELVAGSGRLFNAQAVDALVRLLDRRQLRAA